MNKLKNILLFCGSSQGNNPVFVEAAITLGKFLAEKDCHLIYGAAQIGLMGSCANAVLQAGGKVTGIIPHFLSSKEVAHAGLTEMIEVETMHERKKLMYDKCDAAITLPGGFGTMDELFEMITWAQLGLHKKPIALWNVAGYYDPLLEMMDKMFNQGFVQTAFKNLLLAADDLDNLWQRMENYVAPSVPQFLEEEDL